MMSDPIDDDVLTGALRALRTHAPLRDTSRTLAAGKAELRCDRGVDVGAVSVTAAAAVYLVAVIVTALRL